MPATPIVRFGRSSIGSASATTSRSIPDEANSRSITGAWSLLERVSLTVASRPTAFGTSRNGQAANQREGDFGFSEIGVDVA